jgi:hypothetical protein
MRNFVYFYIFGVLYETAHLATIQLYCTSTHDSCTRAVRCGEHSSFPLQLCKIFIPPSSHSPTLPELTTCPIILLRYQTIKLQRCLPGRHPAQQLWTETVGAWRMRDQLVWAGRSDAPATQKRKDEVCRYISYTHSVGTLVKYKNQQCCCFYMHCYSNKTAKNLQMFKKVS